MNIRRETTDKGQGHASELCPRGRYASRPEQPLMVELQPAGVSPGAGTKRGQ